MESVLVLEDDQELRELLVETLQDEGYTVEGVNRAQQAIEMVTTREFDLFVTDIRMEGMSGLDAVAFLRQRGYNFNVLVITGFASEKDPIRAIKLGVGEYLTKPFSLEEFLAVVGRLARQSSQERLRRQTDAELQELVGWFARRAIELPSVAPDRLERLTRSLEWVRSLAELSEISAEARLDLELALHLVAAAPQLLTDSQGCPKRLAEIFQNLSERWDGGGPRQLKGTQIPLTSRLGNLALTLASRSQSELDLVELAQQEAGRLDPFLIELVPLANQKVGGQTKLAALLDLAIGLLGMDDFSAAKSPLERLGELQLDPGSQALRSFCLARILAHEGQLQAAQQVISQAKDYAAQLSAARSAECLLEGATILRHSGLPLTPLLEQAWKLSVEKESGLRAKLELIRWSSGENLNDQNLPHQALAELLRPENGAHLLPALQWSLIRLLEVSQDEQVAACLPKLVRDHTGLLLHELRYDRVTTKARLALAEPSLATPSSIVHLLSQDADSKVRETAIVARKRSRVEKEGLPPLRVQCFGGFKVWVGGELIPAKAWRGNRVQYLAAYLLAAARPVAEDILLDIFWDEGGDKARRSLHAAISAVRRALRVSGCEGEGEYVVRVQDTLGVNPECQRWCDLDEFDKAFAKVTRNQDPSELGAGLQQCSSLYAGPCLDGCFQDWALEKREHYERLALEVFTRRAEWELNSGQHLAALEQAQEALKLDQCSQKAALLAMKAHQGLGQSEEAVRLFTNLQRRLSRELGMEPSIELMEAYHRARLGLTS